MPFVPRKPSRPVKWIESLEGRQLFASITWAAAVDGSFNDPARWSTGVVPGPGDDVQISAVGGYTVTLSEGVNVGSLVLGGGTDSQTVTLASDGQSLVANAIVVDSHGRLQFQNASIEAFDGLSTAGAAGSAGELRLLGNTTINAPVNVGGLLSAANASNTIAGPLSISPGGNAEVSGELSVADGFAIDGSMALRSTAGTAALLTIGNAGTMTIAAGAGTAAPTLSGSGRIVGNIVNSGRVNLDEDESATTLTIAGDYSQTGAGRLTTLVGRAGAGLTPPLLAVDGTAALSGTLELLALGGGASANQLRKSDTATLVTFGSVFGEFATVEGLPLTPAVGTAGVTVTGTDQPAGGGPSNLVVGVTASSRKPFIGGQAGKAIVAVTNRGSGLAEGTATIRLYASADEALDAGDTLLTELPDAPLKLKEKRTKRLKLAFNYPTTLPSGDYRLVAVAVPGPTIEDASASDNTGATANTLRVEAPTFDFKPTLVGRLPSQLVAGDEVKARVRITNSGNATYSGPLGVDLTAVGTGTFIIQLAATSPAIELKAGKSKVLTIPFSLLSGVQPGAYTLRATIDSENLISETDEANNTADGATFSVF